VIEFILIVERQRAAGFQVIKFSGYQVVTPSGFQIFESPNVVLERRKHFVSKTGRF
jgi:hypothetical protein